MARFSPGLQNAINNLMSGHGTPLRLNPAGRTIEARRSGTCPISGEPISPGDSITKTDAGWVLSQHAGAAMENPRTFRGAQSAERRAQPSKETKRRQAQNESLKDYLREYDPGFRERPRLRQSKTFSTRVGGNLVLQHEKELKSMMPDLSLPAIRKMSPEQVVEALDKRGVMHPEFEGFAMHHFQREYNNPYFENGMGGSAMKYAKKHRVSLKQGWAAVKSGLSNPYHNPNKEAEVQALARQVLRFWPKVSPTAEQQLFFMLNPEYIRGGDSIEMVVASFLGNALGWRGEDARRIKAQLNALLR